MTSARLFTHLKDMTGPLFGCLGFFLFSLYDASMKYLLGTETVFSALAVTQTVCALSIVLFVLTVKRTYRLLLARTPWVVLIYAILFILEMTSFLYAVRQIPLADLFVIILTGPILTLALARFVLQEKLSRSQIVSVGLGFGGVMVMLQCWHLFEGENFFSYPPLALGSAF